MTTIREYNENEMLIIDRIVDAGGDWPSQSEVAVALAEWEATIAGWE